jgi:hypothetical protein
MPFVSACAMASSSVTDGALGVDRAASSIATTSSSGSRVHISAISCASVLMRRSVSRLLAWTSVGTSLEGSAGGGSGGNTGSGAGRLGGGSMLACCTSAPSTHGKCVAP